MNQLQTISPEIRETVWELQLLLKRQQCLEKRDKVAALYLFKLGRINNFSDLVKIIGQEVSALESWFRIYRTQGLLALLRD